MEPAFVLAVGIDAALKRFQIGQEISMRKDDASRLARRAGCVENLGDRASRGCIAWARTSFRGGRRCSHHISKIVDDHRWWRAGKLRLLAVAQDELHARIFDYTLNELGGCRRVHGNNNSSSQQNSPKARNPPCGVGTPEEDAAPGRNSASSKIITPA